MKKRHIRSRILVTLIGLTCALLLTVALAFNLSVRSYLRSRVSSQLHSVSESASEGRKGSGKEGGKRFDEHPAWEDETLPGEFTAVAVKP